MNLHVATITFGQREWLWPAVAALGICALLVLWSYSRGPASGGRFVCALLKLLGLTALALCLLEPLWSGQRARPGANLFAVVADNSQGLNVKEDGQTKTRAEQLAALLGPEGGDWQPVLEENFELRRFSFDTRLQSTRDFSALNFQGAATALRTALSNLRERFDKRPLAGVLLFTDGNATDLGSFPLNLDRLPPVYPVVIGRRSSLIDVAIGQVNVTQSAFEDAPVTVQAEVNTLGLRGHDVLATLTDPGGKRLAEKSLRPRKDSESLMFRFQFRPDRPGLSFYDLNVRMSTEQSGTNAVGTKEATLLNNRRVLAIDRGKGPYRILYVSGRPNWEYKFLNRALDRDPELQLVGLMRIAVREPKFDFRGRGGETSNPLYRGFGNQARENAERYDQPVLIRLNTKDELELRGGFPATAEELFGYRAIIVDDLEAAFFTTDQQMLLQRFVSERGGGLLMLGGMESFQQGKYYRTPIGEILPMYLDGLEETAPPGPVRLNLEREGWLQAWARLRESEAEEKARLHQMPRFQVLNPFRAAKPGASVIAVATDEKGRDYPALLTQRFGRGRTAAFAVGDYWRYGMLDPAARLDMEKGWRQLLRWLIADVPDPLELTVEPAAESQDGSLGLAVRARGASFEPLDDVSVSIEIQSLPQSPSNAPQNSITLRAEPSLKEPGLYEAAYVPRGTTGYRARASVTNSAGISLGQAEAGWATDLVAEEFRSLQPNISLLQEIARRTGGEIIPAQKLADFARGLPKRTAPVMEPWTTPAWHTPFVFAFALACFVAEWGLRRWKGMP